MRSELLRALVDQDFAGEAAVFSGLWTLRTLATLPPPTNRTEVVGSFCILFDVNRKI